MCNLNEIEEIAISDAKAIITNWRETNSFPDSVRKPDNFSNDSFEFYLKILLEKLNEKKEVHKHDFEILSKQESYAQFNIITLPFDSDI